MSLSKPASSLPDDVLRSIEKKCCYTDALRWLSVCTAMRVYLPALKTRLTKTALLLQARIRASLAFTKVLRTLQIDFQNALYEHMGRDPDDLEHVYIRNLCGWMHLRCSDDIEWPGYDNPNPGIQRTRFIAILKGRKGDYMAIAELAARNELKRELIPKWPKRRKTLPPLHAYYVMRTIPGWMHGIDFVGREEYIESGSGEHIPY